MCSNNKNFWKKITEALRQKGSSKIASECKTKMDNLKKAYRACIDHNNGTGNDKAAECEHFDVNFGKKYLYYKN